MSKMCSNCEIFVRGTVKLCPKHAAVDELLAALKKIQWGCEWCGCNECGVRELYHSEHQEDCSIGNAIDKAERG